MKKWIAILLSLSLLALAGCGADEEPEAKIWETAPAANAESLQETTLPAESLSQTEPGEQADSVDLSAFPRENTYNKTSQVGVYAPALTEAGTYTLDFIDVTMEEAFHALRPEDPSSLHMADVNGYQRLYSDSGMSLSLEPGLLNMSIQYEGESQQRSQIFYEIESLLQWKLDHKETGSEDLPFATKKQAQEHCKAALTALGIGLEPKLTGCIGLTHQEAREYQQHLLKTDETYDCFGKVYELPELDEGYDCYYLSYSFHWDGIPVYGDQWFPRISRSDVADRYRSANAQFLVSKDGIQDCWIHGTFGVPQLQQEQLVLSPEDAARIACQELDADLSAYQGQTDQRIEYVSFCLVPRYDDTTGSFELAPMWGAEMSFLVEKTGEWHYGATGGEIFLDGVTGERID